MKDYLVGYTGFVGSNLALSHSFSTVFNSKNIQEAFGGKPDLLVYAGLPAEMFLANQDPEKDYIRIEQAMANIAAIDAKTVVLISTIAVYPDTHGADEETFIDDTMLPAYGKNRLALERWVEKNCPRHLIVHLPAIYGKNLKKNFIYDYIHIIPAMLTEKKFAELAAAASDLPEFYINQDNGYYKCRVLNERETDYLKGLFQRLGFSALNFTDSRSRYQFYPLSRLWTDLEIALKHDLDRVNFVTPPVKVSELYFSLTGKEFINELSKPPFDYALTTLYADLYGGADGFIMSREEEIKNVRDFISREG